MVFTDSTTGLQYLGHKQLECHNVDPTHAVEWPKVAVLHDLNIVDRPAELTDHLQMRTTEFIDLPPQTNHLSHPPPRICTPRYLNCYTNDVHSCTDISLNSDENMEYLCQHLRLNNNSNNSSSKPTCQLMLNKDNQGKIVNKGLSYIMRFTEDGDMVFTSTVKRENWYEVTCSNNAGSGQGGLTCGGLKCRGGRIRLGKECATPNVISIRFSLDMVDTTQLFTFLDLVNDSLHAMPGLEVTLLDEGSVRLGKTQPRRKLIFNMSYRVMVNDRLDDADSMIPAQVVEGVLLGEASRKGLPGHVEVCYGYSPDVAWPKGKDIHTLSFKRNSPRWEECQTLVNSASLLFKSLLTYDTIVVMSIIISKCGI